MVKQQTRGMGPQVPSGFNNTQHNCNRLKRPIRHGCGKRTLVGLVNGKYLHHRHRCKSYQCGLCGPRKVRQVRKRIVQLALEHGLQRFLTLTLDPKKLRPDLDVQGKIAYLQNVWRKMRVSLSRKLGRRLIFIAVVELQGNGNPHFHLLVDSFLPKQWISAAWQRLGGGWATRIEYAQLRRVAAYLAKYVTDDSASDLPARTRRFSTSRGLPLFQRTKSNDPWVLLRLSIDDLRELSSDIVSEVTEIEPDGDVSLRLFVAEGVPRALSERLTNAAAAPLAIEMFPRPRNLKGHRSNVNG
jgi:hypothetical protein